MGTRVHVDRTGGFAMAVPVSRAFPLFSAEGERRWVAGWDPRFFSPAGPQAREGLVFQTTKKDVGIATWIQTRHEPAKGVASFVYVIPNHHVAMVDVRVAADGERGSRASVRYRMTSLSAGADDFVRAFGTAFDGFMVHWRHAIQRHIAEGVPLTGG